MSHLNARLLTYWRYCSFALSHPYMYKVDICIVRLLLKWAWIHQLPFSGNVSTVAVSILLPADPNADSNSDVTTCAWVCFVSKHIDGLVQDCSNSIANALELLQSHIKLLKCYSLGAGYILTKTEMTSFWTKFAQRTLEIWIIFFTDLYSIYVCNNLNFIGTKPTLGSGVGAISD